MIDARPMLAAFLLLAACDRPENERTAAMKTPSPAARPSAAATPPPAPIPEPVFTSLDRAACRLVEENREEGGYARFLCPGRGEYRLEVLEADAREDLVVLRPGGARRQLQLPSSIAAGAFSTLGRTVEWIGTDRLIVRYEIFETPEGTQPTSYLLVVDLAADPACVVAKVAPGPEQNVRARNIAEGTQPACLSAG